MRRAFEYRYVVGFEDTNLVGNVYYANHVRWQGRCRELFLREHAPEVLNDLANGLALVTTKVSCEYLSELRAFDEVRVRMSLDELGPGRIAMIFEYWRVGARDELVARGNQEVVCMHRSTDRPSELSMVPVPPALRDALRPFQPG
jgi:enediyne biosynthesis thioesterase